MDNLQDRLRLTRESLGLSQKQFAEQIGVSFRAWQDYEAGQNVPGGRVFMSLAELGFNTNWLLTGHGELREGVITNETAYKWLVEDGSGPDDSFVKIPRYKVEASAGGGAVIHSEQIVDHLAFRADWVRNALGVPTSALALINVTGDSMEPTLSNGDLILIDMSQPGVDDSAVYVLRFDGKLVVKRIQRKFDGSVVIMSDNAVYPPETIQGDLVSGLNVIGRVVWCGRRM